jgi:hypothetical protein
MIKDYAKFEFNNVKVEANYNDESKPCKNIKITIGKESAEISNTDLFSLLVLYANDEQLDKCITIKPFKVISKMIKVKAKQDFKKGDDIIFPISYEVTPEVADAYYEMQKNNEIAKATAEKMVNNVFK